MREGMSLRMCPTFTSETDDQLRCTGTKQEAHAPHDNESNTMFIGLLAIALSVPRKICNLVQVSLQSKITGDMFCVISDVTARIARAFQ